MTEPGPAVLEEPRAVHHSRDTQAIGNGSESVSVLSVGPGVAGGILRTVVG